MSIFSALQLMRYGVCVSGVRGVQLCSRRESNGQRWPMQQQGELPSSLPLLPGSVRHHFLYHLTGRNAGIHAAHQVNIWPWFTARFRRGIMEINFILTCQFSFMAFWWFYLNIFSRFYPKRCPGFAHMKSCESEHLLKTENRKVVQSCVCFPQFKQITEENRLLVPAVLMWSPPPPLFHVLVETVTRLNAESVETSLWSLEKFSNQTCVLKGKALAPRTVRFFPKLSQLTPLECSASLGLN